MSLDNIIDMGSAIVRIDRIKRLSNLDPSKYHTSLKLIGFSTEIRCTKKVGERWSVLDGLTVDLSNGHVRVHKDSAFGTKKLVNE